MTLLNCSIFNTEKQDGCRSCVRISFINSFVYRTAQNILSSHLDSNPDPTGTFLNECIGSLFCVTPCIITDDILTPRSYCLAPQFQIRYIKQIYLHRKCIGLSLDKKLSINVMCLVMIRSGYEIEWANCICSIAGSLIFTFFTSFINRICCFLQQIYIFC